MSPAARVAVVTGAGRGIGAATARALAEAGLDVVLAARGRDQIGRLATELATAGRRSRAVVCDVTSEASVAALAGEAELVCGDATRHDLAEILGCSPVVRRLREATLARSPLVADDPFRFKFLQDFFQLDFLIGVEAEGAASGQQDAVHALDQRAGLEEVRLAGAGRSPSHLAGGHRPLRAQHHRAAGRPLFVGPVPDAHPRDVRDRGIGRGHDVYRRSTRGPTAHTTS